MRLYQKIILGVVGLIAVGIIGVSAYAIKFYSDANSAFNNIVQKVDRKSTKREAKVNIDNLEPFSVLLLGIDNGALGRGTESGRSDSMMVVTVNPKKKQSTIVSLDRDIYTQIVGYGTMDKLNHAYAFGGVEMAMDSVENLLDIPLDHYVSINMQGLRDLIDAVGGIEVNNKFHFILEGVEMKPGKQTVDGKKGLAYARMRKYDEATGMGDPEGDIGRQKRQREVITAIVNKVLSLDSVTNYQKILKAVEKNTKTDLEWDDMMDIAKNYTGALGNIKQEQLEGEGEMIDGIYYQLLGENSLLKIQNELKTQLDMKTSEALPTGDTYTSGYQEGQFYNDSTGTADAGVQNSIDTQTSDGTYQDAGTNTGY